MDIEKQHFKVQMVLMMMGKNIYIFSKRLKDDDDNIDVVLGTDGLKIRGGRSSIDLIEQLSEAPSDFQTSAFSTRS